MTLHVTHFFHVSRLSKWGCAALTSAVLLFAAHRANAARCEKGVVAIGDTAYEVESKCGEPAFRDERSIEKVKKTGPDEIIRYTIRIEEWAYDFGPNRFIRLFTFHDGKLVRMTQGDYGRSTPEDGPDYVRKNRRVTAGDSKYEVLVKLGKPVYAEKREEEKARRAKNGDVLIDHILYEEWTYDFGPRRFVKMVAFENGRVIRVEHGSYGR